MLRQEAEAFFGAVRFFTRLPVPTPTLALDLLKLQRINESD